MQQEKCVRDSNDLISELNTIISFHILDFLNRKSL